MKLPTSVKIFDVGYQIEYVNTPSDVDIYRRKSLWGQIDFWTRTIRIYRNDRQDSDVWQTIWHEVLHGIANQLEIQKDEIGALGDDEHIIQLLATGINCVLFDNGWMEATKQ